MHVKNIFTLWLCLYSVFYHKDWIQTMLTCNEEMEEESKYGFVDYTMGRDVRKQQDAINTMAGTFRKLNVD